MDDAATLLGASTSSWPFPPLCVASLDDRSQQRLVTAVADSVTRAEFGRFDAMRNAGAYSYQAVRRSSRTRRWPEERWHWAPACASYEVDRASPRGHVDVDNARAGILATAGHARLPLVAPARWINCRARPTAVPAACTAAPCRFLRVRTSMPDGAGRSVLRAPERRAARAV